MTPMPTVEGVVIVIIEYPHLLVVSISEDNPGLELEGL